MALTDTIRETVEFLKFRKCDYQLAFGSPAGQGVLTDLAKFCRAVDTCFHTDAREHAVMEGRREVWLRIQRHLNLTPQDLFELYAGRTVTRLILTEEKNDD